MVKELEVIEKKRTWKLVDKCFIDVKWVFKVKFILDGTIVKHKTGLVAKGFLQNRELII